MTSRISVVEATDLGGGNFRIRLGMGDNENQIVHSDIVSAASCEDAVQKAKEDFSRWLKKVLKVAGKSAA